MVVAPPSWRAATKRTPCRTRALVTWKLPLPTTPKAVVTPSEATARPAASATFIVVHRRVIAVRSSFDQGQHPQRAAGAAHDRQRGGDQNGAGDRQPVEVAELG